MTVSCDDSNPTDMVKPVDRIPTFPFTAEASSGPRDAGVTTNNQRDENQGLVSSEEVSTSPVIYTEYRLVSQSTML